VASAGASLLVFVVLGYMVSSGSLADSQGVCARDLGNE